MADLGRCGVIVLAAGASRRMGRPKQLLPLGPEPLLRHVVLRVLAAGCGRVCVVLGAHAELIRPTLAGLPLDVAVNPGWTEGMGSSLRTGMAALDPARHGLAAVIVVLADQPALTTELFLRLVAEHRRTGQPIVASHRGGQLTPPVLFGPEYFAALASLQGDAGARTLLQAHAGEVARVDADGLADLDTPQDYAAYLRGQGSADSPPAVSS